MPSTPTTTTAAAPTIQNADPRSETTVTTEENQAAVQIPALASTTPAARIPRQYTHDPIAHAIASSLLPLAALAFILSMSKDKTALGDALKTLMATATSLPFISAVLSVAEKRFPKLTLTEKQHLSIHATANLLGMLPAVGIMLYGASKAIYDGDHSDTAYLKVISILLFLVHALTNEVYLAARALFNKPANPTVELVGAVPGFAGSIGFLTVNAILFARARSQAQETSPADLIGASVAFILFTGYLTLLATYKLSLQARANALAAVEGNSNAAVINDAPTTPTTKPNDAHFEELSDDDADERTSLVQHNQDDAAPQRKTSSTPILATQGTFARSQQRAATPEPKHRTEHKRTLTA